MKALVYNRLRDGSVNEVPDAKIERVTDVLVKITSTNICGQGLSGGTRRTSVTGSTK